MNNAHKPISETSECKERPALTIWLFSWSQEMKSFTRATAQLGVSQSALSQTIRGLETRPGARLLTRTTRRVSPPEAAERLFRTVKARFTEVDAELKAVTELRDKPASTIRLTVAATVEATIPVTKSRRRIASPKAGATPIMHN